MKALKGVLICTLAGVILQNLIFLYVEKVYLNDNSKYNIEKVESSAENERREINIAGNAEDVRSSYDGRYISYKDNNKLIICNSKDDSKNEYKQTAGELVYYKWLTDCNKIIAIEKMVKDGEVYFVPISYDAKTTQVNEITDFDMKEVKIKSSSSEAKVSEVAFSTASSSLYIKIEEGNGKSSLYYANQMNQLEKVKKNLVIGNIAVPQTSCDAVMEIGDKIQITNNKNNVNIPNTTKPKIIGSDKNDRVYFASDNNGKTDIIYYADLTQKNYKWSKINLKSEEAIKDIYIDYSGKIYLNDASKNTAKELTTNKEIKYEGDFIDTYSGGIISKKGNKALKNELK